MNESARAIGAVVAIWRYPVKSMEGEKLDEAYIDERGILGDRAYAIVDRVTGHVASAKHPRKWSSLVASQARFVHPVQARAPLPATSITLADGSVVDSTQPDKDTHLSRALGRDVTLVTTPPPRALREANRSPLDREGGQELIQEEPLGIAAAQGTFFDYAPVHILTTATLERFQQLYPAGRFDARRFRPNIVIAPLSNTADFVENGWLGSTLQIGEHLQLRLIDPCPRCVMTTLPQADLPKDPNILRVVTQHNEAPSVTLRPGVVLKGVAGAYGAVAESGMIQRGDVLYQLL